MEYKDGCALMTYKLTDCLTIFFFNLGGQVVADVADVLDAVFHHERDVSRHGKLHL